MSKRTVAEALAAAFLFGAGILLGGLAFADDAPANQSAPPTVVTSQLAPNGMAYCPTDPATPHITPCLNKP